MNTYPKSVYRWLLSGCVLIYLMVLVGGITRLSGSGLSITEWKIVTGTLPPLSEQQWLKEFEAYKQTPQFKKINSEFTLTDFESIYWWEYIHRLIARFIAVVFIVPFFYFIYKKLFDRAFIKKLLVLLGLGAMQGLIGWLMVASGLVDNPYVSHYRLALHLIAALTCFGYCLWLALDLRFATHPIPAQRSRYFTLAVFLLALLVVQIIYGAFVAGLHAGKFYTTFPDMNGAWIPDFELSPLIRNFVEGIGGVQFIHRLLGYAVALAALVLWLRTARSESRRLRISALVLFVAILIQATLGVVTLLNAAPMALALVHQSGAVVVLTIAIIHIHVSLYTRDPLS